ncbi:MAG: hypothetical protein HGGPFJEG_00680 [Ignavibacteria bacterium]|nr:hypothetical protein [Ignavibacteria bacterium]
MIGKKIFNNIFPSLPSENLEVFNILYPFTRSFCNIDLVVKEYTLNLSGKEL